MTRVRMENTVGDPGYGHRYDLEANAISTQINPYEPTDNEDPIPTAGSDHRSYKGPALYIALSAMLAGPSCVLILGLNHPFFGFVGVIVGLPIGGVIYRLRSQGWPVDEGVRKRQVMVLSYGALMLVFCFFAASARSVSFILFSLALFGSFALSILLAGRRRL